MASNPFYEVNKAVQEAERLERAVNENARDMAALLVGRLRGVSRNSYPGVKTLCALKRELRDFNMTTGRWNG